ncbi:MAG: TonB-dependent receptor [Ignavibacteriales bacterium]|nr:MAG: TonB-dependent receptor [Ignavibacteriales bacterium]
MRKAIQLFVAVIFFSTNIVFAGTTGKITGKVLDQKTGEPLPFVNIILEGTNYGAATDLEGEYVILNLPPGRYSVKAQAIGYQAQIVQNVLVSIDQTTEVNFTLSEVAVELEAIVVEGKSDLVKKDVTSSQSSVSSEQIERLPVAEFDDVLQLQAGVTRGADGSFHIRGGRTSEIAYWVNGISITDAYDNSRGIQIDNNSVQELQVISGTFNAEYGNAMSGIVNTVTKEGGREYHGSLMIYSSDHISNFTEYFPHIDNIDPVSTYNFQGSIGGPVPFTNNIVSFFINGRYNYDDGYLYGERRYNPDGTQGDSKVVPMNWRKNYYGQGNISFSPLQEIKINLEGLYSKEDYRDYNHEYRWNPEGDVKKFSESYNGTATFTHMLSSATFYTAKGSFFQKDFNEYLYENPYDTRYFSPDSFQNRASYSFLTKGTNLHRFFRATNTYQGRVDFTSQVTKDNLIKFGAEVKSHNLKFDDYNLQPEVINGVTTQPFKPAIPGVTEPNRVKYNNDPFEMAAYIQDKIEFENVIINIGVRFDYFDANGKVLYEGTYNGKSINSFKDPNIYAPLRAPSFFGINTPNDTWKDVADITQYTSMLEPYFYKDSETKMQVSPRFGIAYPISAAGVVHFSYGHFLQIPPFQYLFADGPYYVPNDGSFVGLYGNPNLEAQKTVMYELGFRQEFWSDYLIDITGFYRDVRDWITAGPPISTQIGVTYSIYTNKDYANVKGITLTFNKVFKDNFAFDINYTYQVAEGTNSRPEEEFFAFQGNSEPSLYLIPMDWDQNHLLNASVYTGFDGWGASLIARYGTGLPYTPTVTQYTAERLTGGGFLRNSRRIPAQFTLDLKVDKTFQVMDFNITAFVRVFNLLDNRIPVTVFGDTGQPDFTTELQSVGFDPRRPNTPEEFIKYPGHFGEPRNVQFGFDLAF